MKVILTIDTKEIKISWKDMTPRIDSDNIVVFLAKKLCENQDWSYCSRCNGLVSMSWIVAKADESTKSHVSINPHTIALNSAR
jgi:hypothetical protein